MPDVIIPFEIHITTKTLSLSQRDAFAGFCYSHEAKPLMIELAKGEHTDQPMFSKVVYLKNIDEALDVSTEYSLLLNKSNFEVVRLKIETMPGFAGLFQNEETGAFGKYYEWHGKVNFTDVDNLYAMCELHRVHLSLNSLKNEAGMRFITLREFGLERVFKVRIDALSKGLKTGGWQLTKQQSEYCIYDNNCFLDNGWLPDKEL